MYQRLPLQHQPSSPKPPCCCRIRWKALRQMLQGDLSEATSMPSFPAISMLVAFPSLAKFCAFKVPEATTFPTTCNGAVGLVVPMPTLPFTTKLATPAKPSDERRKVSVAERVRYRSDAPGGSDIFVSVDQESPPAAFIIIPVPDPCPLSATRRTPARKEVKFCSISRRRKTKGAAKIKFGTWRRRPDPDIALNQEAVRRRGGAHITRCRP